MLFSVRLISRQPSDVSPDAWQQIVSEQYRAVKQLYDTGKIKAIYREVGVGVLAIFEVNDAREMDQLLAGLPMFRYFVDISVHALWDMAPTLASA